MLELASGRVDRGVKTDPPNLFTNISRGSDIFGRGSNPLTPGKYSPAFMYPVNFVYKIQVGWKPNWALYSRIGLTSKALYNRTGSMHLKHLNISEDR